jgi:membrane protein implicated in regulation of membrane protease activity
MKKDRVPELEMTIDGDFVSPPKPPLSTKIMIWAIVIALIAGGLSLAALALWLALLILPIAVGAAVVAWALFRYRLWRDRQLLRNQRDVWRP